MTKLKISIAIINPRVIEINIGWAIGREPVAMIISLATNFSTRLAYYIHAMLIGSLRYQSTHQYKLRMVAGTLMPPDAQSRFLRFLNIRE